MASFCRRCRSQPVSFVLTATDLRALAEVIPESRFDRIDVSNVMDACYLDVGTTLTCINPLLNEANTHSTVVSLFMNAIGIMEEHRKAAMLKTLLKQVQRYLPMDKPPMGRYDPELLRQLVAADMFLPFDEWFADYTERFQVHKAASQTNFQAKRSNTVVMPWPLKFHPGLGDMQDKDRFWKVLGSGNTGAERYVEWRRL